VLSVSFQARRHVRLRSGGSRRRGPMIHALLGDDRLHTISDLAQQTGLTLPLEFAVESDILNTTFDTVPPANGNLHP